MTMGYGIPQAFQEAFGQTVIGKQPGQAAFYDFQFEYQGPATRVFYHAFMGSIDTGAEGFVDLPQATNWSLVQRRINFTVPASIAPGDYAPMVRICDRQDCLGQLIWAQTSAFFIAVQSAVPPFGFQNAAVTNVG